MTMLSSAVLVLAVAGIVQGVHLRASADKASAAKRACKTNANATLDPFDCYSDDGANYIGLQDHTNSGRGCRNWLDQGKYKSTVKGIGNHQYCRNPKGSKDKPWCFVQDPEKDWEYCVVPECKGAQEAPKPWKAPKGTKSEANAEPCEYDPPKKPEFEEFKADRACMDSRGETWWLIGQKKFDVSDKDGCLGKCKALPGSDYFNFFGKKDDDGNNCGCYRDCILVDKKLTTNSPTAYKIA